MRFRILSFLLLLAMIAITAHFIRKEAMNAELSWGTYSAQRVEALVADQKIVLVSVHGNWTINPLVHERIAIGNAGMKQFIRAQNVVPLRADITNGDPAVRKLIADHGLKSVPAFIIYSPNNAANPDVLPDFPSEEQLRHVLALARESSVTP